MIIHNVVQGTPEWLRLRAGIPTASDFDNIVTPGGKPSKSAEPYMFRLLAERCMGHPIAEYVSLWMQRGSEQEINAVRFYEFQRDCTTMPIGFVTNDAKTKGASPDRFVDKDGQLEIKAPSEWVHMAYLLSAGGAYEKYKVQVQAQLYITGRQWTDVMSYHPELPEALIRIERDEKFIEILATESDAFVEKLEKHWVEVQERGWARTAQEKLTDQLERSVKGLQPLPPLEDLVASARRALGETRL